MNEAFRFLAAQQQEKTLHRITAYIETHNPELTHQAAVAMAQVVAEYFQMPPHMQPPSADGGFFVNRARELGRSLKDPDAYQNYLDKRERRRNAPIDRAYRDLKAKEHAERVKKELGYPAQQTRLVDERAKDMAKGVVDWMKKRKSPAEPQQPAQVDPTPPAEDLNHPGPEHERNQEAANFVRGGPLPASVPARPQQAEQPLHLTEPDDDDDGNYEQEVLQRLRAKDPKPGPGAAAPQTPRRTAPAPAAPKSPLDPDWSA